ncbi:MAG: efflux transporter outer membrane subunit [Succinivibrionaceae bacterium]|nr:efflux transporter outer membrane subunit [Succinivibrionaceae bacterium]
MKRVSTALLVAPLALLCACTHFHTPYERPALEQVAAFPAEDKFQGQDLMGKFWEAFQDQRLNAIIERVLERNLDLRTALLSLDKARAQLGIAESALHPTLSESIAASRKKNFENGTTTNASTTGFSLSWEVDFMGRISADREAAYQTLRATALDYLATRLSLISTTASAYWQYSYAQEACRLGEQEVADSKTRLNTIEGKYSVGSVDLLEVDTARLNHVKVLEQLASREAARDKARTALNTLLGQTADHDEDVGKLEDATAPDFSLGIPAQLLERRPDLMGAEAKLRSALSGYDSARLAFFPTFTINAGLTTGSASTLARFLADPIGSIGAAITLPFLNYNELSKKEESALKDYEIAQLAFVKTYISAVQDVYDCLTTVGLYERQTRLKKQELELARNNYSRYFERYSTGVTPINDLLDAADNLRSASLGLLEIRRDGLGARMALMAAIGGDSTDPTVMEKVMDPAEHQAQQAKAAPAATAATAQP